MSERYEILCHDPETEAMINMAIDIINKIDEDIEGVEVERQK